MPQFPALAALASTTLRNHGPRRVERRIVSTAHDNVHVASLNDDSSARKCDCEVVRHDTL